MQEAVDAVYVDPALIEYAVRLANATREPPQSAGRAEPLRHLRRQPARLDQPDPGRARALALIRGRDYALPHDVTDMALDVLRHRLVLSYEALADGVTADDVLTASWPTRSGARPRPERPQRDDWTAPSPDAGPLLHRLEWRSSVASTGCCRAPTAPCSAATASTSPTCASTSRRTTSGTSTGTSPRAWTRRTCASTPRTAS